LSMQQYTMNNNPCKYDFHYQLKLDDAGSWADCWLGGVPLIAPIR
jgi:hypothetical protein